MALEIPNPKSQIPSESQAPNSKEDGEDVQFGHWKF
jgi:hypothetical protein